MRCNARRERRKQARESSHAEKKAKTQKKWSLWRHWKAANRRKQAEWILAVIGAMTGVGVIGVYIWGNLQTKWHFAVERRPKVVVSRPPELLGSFECYVTDKAIHFHNGPMRIWVKNIRKSDAVGAFVAGPDFKLVPEKKVGYPFFDDPPSVTDDMCKQNVSPKMKAFPVYGDQEVGVGMVHGIGAVSLSKQTKSISATFGGPQQEPETLSDAKPSDRVQVDKDAAFQLYAPVCVYYFDENGLRYGSCRDYRFVVAGRSLNSDPYAFSCTESPVKGVFEQTLFGYCEN